MPIYEYRCKKCDHHLDALQKMSDAPLTDCPECGESALKKLVSAPNFRLKGSGWYETDFKKDNQRNLADSGDGKTEKSDKSANQDKSAGGDGKTSTTDKTSDKSATKNPAKKTAGDGN